MINYFILIIAMLNLVGILFILRSTTVRWMKIKETIDEPTYQGGAYLGNALKTQRAKPKIIKETVFEDEEKL